jgi:uncharacterized membrane protein
MVKKSKKKPKKKNLPISQPQKNQGAPHRAVATATAQSFSGPLPPPQILEKYNQVVPDAAERIIAMAESQSKHRQRLEVTVIDSDIRNSRLGLHYGLIIGLATVIGGAFCIYSGYEIGGTVLGGSGLTGLVSVFVYGSTQRRKERERRFRSIVNGNQKD